MKKRFLSKSLIAKIALVLVLILLFEFAMAEPVGAAEIGGTLLRPIVNLVVFLADGVITILQSTLLSMEQSFLYIDLNDDGGLISKVKKVITCAVAVILVGAVVVGIILAAIPSAVAAAITATTAGIVSCVAVRNSCRCIYCKILLSNCSCCIASYVWEKFRLCQYWDNP